MELSESVQKGLQSLADPSLFDLKTSSGVKQNVDKSTISPLVNLYFGCPFSIGRCPPHINDVSWRLEYLIKNGHVHKVNEPSYLISLNLEVCPFPEPNDLKLCTMEQLQVANFKSIEIGAREK
uniref:COMM domain-containing protein 3 n=1 Tax=Oncorhynchus tshawytscha TaxID=74940 RepID=A0A8C8D775_ONCTS